MVSKRIRYGWGVLLGYLVVTIACTAAVHDRSHTQLSPLDRDPAKRDFNQAQALYQEGLQALDEADPERARAAFDEAARLLMKITPTDPPYAEARDLLETIMETSVEADQELEPELPPEIEEPAFIDSIGDVELPLTKGELEDLARTASPREAVTFDLPVILNEPVLKMIRAFQTVRRREFERGLQRLPRFIDLYRQMFADAGLPRDLAYLALLESGFNHRAYSRARAKGIWQFIYGTGRKYGLTVNWWLDERGDFLKSTEAAIRYLRDLYAQFNDWWLALAAYNSGEKRIQRAIRRAGTRDYWKLRRTRYLPRETRNYVPAFLASLWIAKDPERYGFRTPTTRPLEWEVIPVEGGISLRRIARALGVDEGTLHLLNGALRRRYIPANVTYPLRVPRSVAAIARSRLAALPRNTAAEYTVYRVRRGDTLWHIARRFGVPLSVIMEANNLSRRSLLRIGQRIQVPLYARTYRRRSRRRARPASEVHVVRRGETFYSIARAYGISIRALMRANPRVAPRRLRPGMRIYLPHKSVRTTANKGNERYHIVRPGDTLYGIARLYRVSLRRLLKYNQLTKKSLLYPGDRIRIPPAEEAYGNSGTSSR